ncbi:MAG: DUF6265 family protein [Terriglobia bacterium]
MNHHRGIPAVLAFLLALLAFGPAQAQTPKATIDDFAWLAGRWEGRLPGGPRLEQVWTEPLAGHMLGMFRLLDQGKVVLLEIFSLYETPEGLKFYVRHFNPSLVPGEKGDAILLRLASYGGERYLFENPVHNRPKNAAFMRTGRDGFLARSEIIGDDGQMQVIEANWWRAEPRQRALHKEATVPASLEEIWQAWTTEEGVTSFFAPQAHVEPVLGGLYELYFDPSQPYGSRGSEGCRIHSFVPLKLLAFQWSAPPHLSQVRPLRTLVFVRFYELGPKETRVTVTHSGWGEGEQWDKAYAYFDSAWDAVLGNLEYRFTVGPVDWPGHFIRAGQAE